MDMLEYVACIFGSNGLFTHFRQWDPRYRIKVRVICARAYHALFMVGRIIRSNP